MNRISASVAVIATALVVPGFAQSVSSAPPSPDKASSAATSPAISVLERNATEPNPTDSENENAVDPASLIPDLPPLPDAKATLVGGIVQKVDRVQDRVTLRLFGGGKTTIFFDGRTSVYRDRQPASLTELKPGERIYVDTILYDDMVFARNIDLRTGRAQGESQGIVLSYRPNRNELIVRDVTAPTPLKLRIAASTHIVRNGQPSSASYLREGALVSLRFGAESEDRDVAQQITILAEPGAAFTFVGKVKFLDLHTGLLVLTSATNNKTYEIYLSPYVPVDQNLREGADITALTRFEGNRYVAHNLTVKPAAK
jgi:hypothetical protein